MPLDPSGERLPANERWDRLLELLSAEPRRMVILSLMEVPEERQVPLPDAADSPNMSMDPATLRMHLRHNHLPKLADAGYIRWERGSCYVERGPRFEEAEVVMTETLDSADKFPQTLINGCKLLEEITQR